VAASQAAGTERHPVSAPAILVRKCQTLEEMRACVDLQKEVWGLSDIELVPLRMFVVADKIGGQVIGAFTNDQLIGFALAIPAVRNRHSFLYSQMLAVRQQYRNFGVGRRLKLFQRDEALGRGFELMEWTFDPLEIKNAYLNIEKLGAIVRRYNVNQYGITSSPLQGGLPSDRLVAEWWLKSKRVENLLKGRAKAHFENKKAIAVPAQIYEWKSKPETRNRAQQVQDRNRTEFLEAFAKGLTVLGYERDQQGNGSFLLGRWDEKWSYS
jgi:predicted GNAT superfamily acetyltransferase